MSVITIIVVCLILSAFFSGMEIAFISSNKLKIELDNQLGNFSASQIAYFNKRPSMLISTLLVGNNVALVVYGIYMAKILEPKLAPYLPGEAPILVAQTILSTLLVLVTAEFLPKTLFRINSNWWLWKFAVPLRIFYILLYPLVAITIGASRFFLRLFFGETSEEEKPVFGRIDLDNFVREATERESPGAEIEHEFQIFKNALKFSTIKAREFMIPRNEIVALENDTSIEELKAKFIETGLSKILVYKDNIDNIIGYVKSFELFKKPTSISSILLPITFVPEASMADDILKIFIEEKKSLAVVVDEFGGTSGMITLEDVVEEIFGDIEDEHDTEELVERQIDAHTFEFSTRLEIDYLNDTYKLEIPDSEEYATLAGYILSLHGSIPNVNEIISTEEFDFIIQKVENNRIDQVRMMLKSKD